MRRGALEPVQAPDLSNVTWSPAYDSCGYEHYMPDPNPGALQQRTVSMNTLHRTVCKKDILSSCF